MVTLEQVIEIARINFERFQANLDLDLVAAKTPAQARQVRERRDQALAAYMDLIGRSLDEFTGDWDALSGRATAAAAAVDAALASARERAESVRLMAQCTSAVGDVVKAFRD